MSVQQQARALMSRHHQLIRNREQSMLLRAEAELDVNVDVTRFHSHVRGMTPYNFGQSLDRGHTTMS
jgi:hypothetical protein